MIKLKIKGFAEIITPKMYIFKNFKVEVYIFV